MPLTKRYEEILKLSKAITDGVRSGISNLANVAAVLFEYLDDVNWAGFYLAGEADGQEALLLGPFQGRPACVVIKRGRGVCGTAMAEERTVVVEDVTEFPGHIACDPKSRSEIVVPVFVDGVLFGVIDIDSEKQGRFGDDDREGLEALAGFIGELLSRPGSLRNEAFASSTAKGSKS